MFYLLNTLNVQRVKKQKKWLQDNQICFDDRHIVEQNPTADELKLWLKLSDRPLKSFFNTSGLLYKSMDLKNKLPLMSEEEQFQLLATNGMLVKRPLLITPDSVLIGFKEKEWQTLLLK